MDLISVYKRLSDRRRLLARLAESECGVPFHLTHPLVDAAPSNRRNIPSS